MPSATTEYVDNAVNQRRFPIEQVIENLKREVDSMKMMLASRDADWQASEQRFEEISKMVRQMERDKMSEASDDSGYRPGS